MQEPNNLADLLKMEAPQLYSREEVKTHKDLVMGMVVSKSKSGEIVQLKPTATDGIQTVEGVYILPNVIIVRDAVLSDKAVVWPEGITAEQKTKTVNQLKDKGIVIRKSA